jgi:hypothetical protein
MFLETPFHKFHRRFLVRKVCASVTRKACVAETRSVRLHASTEDILCHQTRRTFCRLSRNSVETRKSGFCSSESQPFSLCPHGPAVLFLLLAASAQSVHPQYRHYIPLCNRIVSLFFACRPIAYF